MSGSAETWYSLSRWVQHLPMPGAIGESWQSVTSRARGLVADLPPLLSWLEEEWLYYIVIGTLGFILLRYVFGRYLYTDDGKRATAVKQAQKSAARGTRHIRKRSEHIIRAAKEKAGQGLLAAGGEPLKKFKEALQTKPLQFEEVFPEELAMILKRRSTLALDRVAPASMSSESELEHADPIRDRFSPQVVESDDSPLGSPRVTFKSKKKGKKKGGVARDDVDSPAPVTLCSPRTPGHGLRHMRTTDIERTKGGMRFNISSRAQPCVSHGLVGLAISGGGVRSATYSLGVLQALAKNGFLEHVDYLSTVSGGGFMGACVSSLLSSEGASSDWSNFPLRHTLGEQEGPALRHLRRNANYLGSTMVDQLQVPILIVRGFILNLVAIFPFVWFLALAKHYTFLGSCVTYPEEGFVWTQCFGASYVVGLNFLIHILLFPILARPFVSGYTIFVFGCMYHHRLAAFMPTLWGDWIWTLSTLLHIILSIPQLFAGLNRRKVWFDESFAWLAFALIGATFLDLLSLLERWYRSHFQDGVTPAIVLVAIAVLLVADSAAVSIIVDSDTLGPWKRFAFSVFITTSGPALLAFYYVQFSAFLSYHLDVSGLFGFPSVVCLFVSIMAHFCLDVNETSMHKFYRARISDAFLFRLGRNGNIVPSGGDKLSQMNKSYIAPYHLINATVNFSRESRDGLRLGDFFVFSKLFVGSVSSGYRRTRTMELHDRNLDIATAVSVSGAAMSPHMGTSTISSMVLSLGILNVRLGYWLPNPSGLKLSSTVFGRLFYGFSWLYLLKEFGWPHMSPSDWRVNLSDGGHLENLGAYELIRRRCKFVVVCDGEADPGFSFNGLATLIRMARLDFGCTIQINLEPLRPDPKTGFSQRHWTVGRIVYHKGYGSATCEHALPSSYGHGSSSDQDSGDAPEGEVGYLLYIKAARKGDEDEVIREYAHRNPSFPHESTSDQAFSEDQFEAYRSLGYKSANKHLFGDRFAKRFDGVNVEPFFRSLNETSTKLGPHGRHNSDLPKGWLARTDKKTGETFFTYTKQNKGQEMKTWTDPRLKAELSMDDDV